ncbi:MAG: 2-hydroxyacid dehydrogenase [Spirochaetaceae bacterium]|jgi:phosphoglycerate dehydrogenase-like enzyme|nr:2-hydroxyacid dehydrogenase [Spirochaetaceae bacterium]
MNILFFSHLTNEFPDLIEPLRMKYPDSDFIFAESKSEYEKFLKKAHILITGNPSDSDLKKANSLNLLIIPFAGVAQLNRPLLNEQGIRVANSHGNAPIVAERAMALAMACCGRIVEFHNDLKKGNWHRTGDLKKPFDYWFSMIGKKVSILGTGAIGTSIAKLLQGFQCEIKGFRRNISESRAYFNSLTDNLEEALAFGEIIFIALPMTDKTKGIISEKNIFLLQNKFIVNVGRGELIEELPFFNALQSKEIAGAAIDAWYEYPSKDKTPTTGSEFPFSDLTNVVISPHAASHAQEGKMGQLKGVLEVIELFITEGKVLNEIFDEY